MDINGIVNNNNKISNRVMLHSLVGCPYKCQYCFAKWEQYQNNISYIENIRNNIIIYPFCDSEVLFQNHMDNLSVIADKSIHEKKRIVISISTKSNLSKSILNDLESVHKKLKINGGFIKLGVSFSNKSIPTIEKGTTQYYERIELLRKLSEYSIKVSVVLKPILPFITVGEYIEIVNETIRFTDKYLLGGLYVQEHTDFYKHYIEGKYITTQRKVEWLTGVSWSYIDSAETQNEIKSYILSQGKFVFDSDQELVESWLSL
ncbi:MAG: hypothetical protein FWC47_05550 [Oscillospiraceae bacterium]|nr:hypothetical protein [Oscillospiraceae bacterium]